MTRTRPHASEALQAYRSHDRIHHDPEPGQALDDLIEDWWTARKAGSEALMLASRHENVTALNDRARRRMRHADRLGPGDVELGGRSFATGDEVLGLENDYRLGILNGTRATIDAIDVETRAMSLSPVDGSKPLVVPFAYAEDRHLTHGYAMTIHKAQGATTDHALVLVDETMSRESIYTAMSRGRQRNDLYLDAGSDRDEFAHAPELQPDPVDALLDGIIRSNAQAMAIEHEGLGRSL